MVDKFTPDPIGEPQSAEELLQWTQQQLDKISRLLEQFLPQAPDELHVEPEKKTELLMVVADGNNWDPGSGRGIYMWAGNKWNLVTALPPRTTLPPVVSPEEPVEPLPPPDLPVQGLAVATFHCMGLKWQPPSAPASGETVVEFKKASDSVWLEGLPMWYDDRDGLSKGSVVALDSNTEYDFRFSMVLGSPLSAIRAKTWNENPPTVAKALPFSGGAERTTMIDAGKDTRTDRSHVSQFAVLYITEGGTPDAYALYDFTGTGTSVRAPNQNDRYGVVVDADYVILRGLTVRGGEIGVYPRVGRHDVWTEGCDIADWGIDSGVTMIAPFSNNIAVNEGAGIKHHYWNQPNLAQTKRWVIQRCKIHDPRYGSNPWDIRADNGQLCSAGNCHPRGTNGIFLGNTGGNHVIRYNEFYSGSLGKYTMDSIGGTENFSDKGCPGDDSDIYGNVVSGCVDDGIEAEGGNENVRIWGNYLDSVATGIATTSITKGPVYIFRNVLDRHRKYYMKNVDNDDRLAAYKSYSNPESRRGRRWLLHNTLLQRNNPDGAFPLGCGTGVQGSSGQPLMNTHIHNNIMQVWKSNWSSYWAGESKGTNAATHELYNGQVSNMAAPTNSVKGTPTYKAGHGNEAGSTGKYQLNPGSSGHDTGRVLKNFNDVNSAFPAIGAGPDMGAHEEGSGDMIFGVNSTVR